MARGGVRDCVALDTVVAIAERELRKKIRIAWWWHSVGSLRERTQRQYIVERVETSRERRRRNSQCFKNLETFARRKIRWAKGFNFLTHVENPKISLGKPQMLVG